MAGPGGGNRIDTSLTADLRYVYTDDDAKIACVGCSSNKIVGTIKASF